MANTPQTTVAIATGTQRTGDSAAQKIHATAKIAVKLSIPCAFSLFLNVLSTNTLHVVEQPPSFAIQVNVQLPIPVALITVCPSSNLSTIATDLSLDFHSYEESKQLLGSTKTEIDSV